MENEYPEVDLSLMFIMAGVSKKNNKPYLQVSDGIEAKFVAFEDGATFPEELKTYKKRDIIKLRLRLEPFNAQPTLVAIL